MDVIRDLERGAAGSHLRAHRESACVDALLILAGRSQRLIWRPIFTEIACSRPAAADIPAYFIYSSMADPFAAQAFNRRMGMSHAHRVQRSNAMTKFKTAIAIAVGTLFAGAAFAQSNSSIEQRDRIEQERIDRGIQSGQLTPREASRLEGERAQIERLERRSRADGVMTQNERARIDRAQDRLGRDITRETHDRQTANSNWRGSDRPQGWDRRGGNEQRNFDRGNRPGQFDHREAMRGERNQAHFDGGAVRTGNDTRSGNDARLARSDSAQGRQAHDVQGNQGPQGQQGQQGQQAQTQRSWNRPAQAGSTAASPVAQQAQTQRSWNRPAQAASPASAASPVAQQAQRSWNRPAAQPSTNRPSAASGPIQVARQGGYGGHRSR
jgi:hypothetical protein